MPIWVNKEQATLFNNYIENQEDISVGKQNALTVKDELELIQKLLIAHRDECKSGHASEVKSLMNNAFKNGVQREFISDYNIANSVINNINSFFGGIEILLKKEKKKSPSAFANFFIFGASSRKDNEDNILDENLKNILPLSDDGHFIDVVPFYFALMDAKGLLYNGEYEDGLFSSKLDLALFKMGLPTLPYIESDNFMDIIVKEHEILQLEEKYQDFFQRQEGADKDTPVIPISVQKTMSTTSSEEQYPDIGGKEMQVDQVRAAVGAGRKSFWNVFLSPF